MKSCQVCEALQKYAPIYKTNHWSIGLSPDQAYFGRSYVSTDIHIETISDLDDEQWQDLRLVMKKADLVFRKEFGAAVMNWSCLTNNAFQSKPYNPHIHWHLRPRYDCAVKVAGLVFTDPEFGYHYDRNRHNELSSEDFEKIQERVKSAFKKY
jgi:diadenosine tetraphosphate (Ap4A) HIT family hydrolase